MSSHAFSVKQAALCAFLALEGEGFLPRDAALRISIFQGPRSGTARPSRSSRAWALAGSGWP